MTKVKICGVTRPEDAAYAAELGADFIGMIFVKESPRCLTVERAREVVQAGAGAKFVGVFRDSPMEDVERVANEAGLDCVQLHGRETYRLQLPTIKTFHVQDDTIPDTSTDADYVLFDTGGGTGRTFDWTALKNHKPAKPFFLAGGITPDNVARAIDVARPFAIDLASGVESAPGIKDHHKMRMLFERVKNR